MESMSESATLLKEARREAGLTQAELARRLGVSQAAVAKLERPGSNVTIATSPGRIGGCAVTPAVTVDVFMNIWSFVGSEIEQLV